MLVEIDAAWNSVDIEVDYQQSNSDKFQLIIAFSE